MVKINQSIREQSTYGNEQYEIKLTINTSTFTTYMTKENEDNNLLSLTDQLEAWEEKFWLFSQMRKLHI